MSKASRTTTRKTATTKTTTSKGATSFDSFGELKMRAVLGQQDVKLQVDFATAEPEFALPIAA